MHSRFFAKRLLCPCIIIILALNLSMIKSAGAIPMPPTIAGNFPNSEKGGNSDCQPLCQVFPDSHEFPSLTIDLTTATVDTLTAMLFTVVQLPQHLEGRPGTGSIQGFSAAFPSELRSFPAQSPHIAAMSHPALFYSDDFTGHFLVNGPHFPMYGADDAFAPFARQPHHPIPEPSTLAFFITAIGSIYAYGLWRRRTQEAAQSSSETRAAEVMQDINNALTAIHTCAEVLGYDDLDPRDRQEFARRMVGQIEQCMTMIQEFLGSRPDRSSNSGCQSPCQVSEFHRQTAEDSPMNQAMNVLLLDPEKTWVEDVQEAFQNLPFSIYVAGSQQEARQILARHPVEIAIFALRTLTDLEFLHELNTAYRQIEVILTVENSVKEIVTILQEGAYQILEAPVMPSVLRTYVETITTKNRGIRE